MKQDFSCVLPVQKLYSDAILPTRAHPDDAGLDLYAIEDIEILPGQGKAVKTGIAIALSAGTVGLIADRSSLAKKGLKTAGGVIDSGYRGELQVVLWNLSRETVCMKRGERIAQLLVLPVLTQKIQSAQLLQETARGTGGFGSTGQ